MDLGKEEPGVNQDSAYMVMDIHKSIELNKGMDYMEMGSNTIGNTSQESLLGKHFIRPFSFKKEGNGINCNITLGDGASSISGFGSWRGEDIISSSLPNSHVLPPTIQVNK